jgi:hypothetical protein
MDPACRICSQSRLRESNPEALHFSADQQVPDFSCTEPEPDRFELLLTSQDPHDN